MLLTDVESGVVFELDATAIKEMHTRHGSKGDYTEIKTDFETFRVKEAVPYVCMLVTKVKDNAGALLGKLYSMWRKEFTLLTVDDILDRATEEEIEFFYHEICARR